MSPLHHNIMKEQFVFANKKYCFLTPVEIPNEPFENYASYLGMSQLKNELNWCFTLRENGKSVKKNGCTLKYRIPLKPLKLLFNTGT